MEIYSRQSAQRRHRADMATIRSVGGQSRRQVKTGPMVLFDD